MVTVENTHSREPVLHRVGGGRYSWKPNVNFTDWAIDEQFFVGGWLYFGFNKQLYSVLQVNETSYTNCIEENGKGYRFKRMKVAIFVQTYQPFPITNGSLLNNVNSDSNFQAKLILLVLILHVYYFKSIAFLFFYILF
ncbi:hypothetical protein ERO13_D05G101550v2 [Gossypium hirsutum]|nr:hypothetical protein ERO13_D05G101550v2 [Gossypium hirsutum]